MQNPSRPMAFVLGATAHGTMIFNRNDYATNATGGFFGVGSQLMGACQFDPDEVHFLRALLSLRRKHHGDGVFAIDGGANVGVHSVEWGKHMFGWGSVLSFEAQELIYYALCGNVVLNNCLNVRTKLMALGETCGEISIPAIDYYLPASYGSLELKQKESSEFIGQELGSASAENAPRVPLVNIDSITFSRLDLLKLDVEGMECEVLRGAKETIKKHKPCMVIEIIKSDQAWIKNFLEELGYEHYVLGLNALAVHKDDPMLKDFSLEDGMLTLVDM